MKIKPLFGSLFLLLAACDPDSNEATGGAGGDLASTSTGTDTLACPAPTHGPTHHSGDVHAHEVWTADASPHIVDDDVRIRDGAVLEIEPCAVVELASSKSITVAFPITPNAGTLVAEGTAEQPIGFEGEDGARWGHLQIEAPGTARLSHLTISGGGGVDTSGASLVVHGDGTLPTKQLVSVDHVSIDRSLGAGLSMTRKAAFTSGSDSLTITRSGSSAHPFPMEVDEAALGSIPAGAYAGNARDEILVDPLDRMQEDATIHDRGVPYRIGNDDTDTLVVGAGDPSAPRATLTIEPGVTMRFHAHASLQVEHFTGDFPASGSLVAVGTSDRPITFTSAADTPMPGDWRGLWFGGVVSTDTRIEHARIEYTGDDCGCILESCSAVDSYAGAVIVTREPPSAFVTHSVIAHASENGFVLGYRGAGFDFAGENTFDDVAGCPATLPSADTCPDPKPSCNGG